MKDLSRSQFGPFSIDVRERVLSRHGQAVPLTPKAFDLLAALLEKPGQLLTKEELLQKVWPDTFVEESNLAYNVFALRKALGDSADNAQYIETVPKRGYRFTATVTTLDNPNGGPAPLRSGGPGRSGSLQTALMQAPAGVLPFRKDGSGRHQTMAQSETVLEDQVPESRPAENRESPPVVRSSRRWAVATAVGLLIAGVYFAVQSRRAPTHTDPLHALPLTSLPGVVRSPSLSPDGTYVVFSWTGPKQDNPDIYIQQIGAGAPLRLTSDPSNDYSPSWSPDGRTVAFLRRGPAGGRSEIWRIAPLGGLERKVAEIEPRLAFFRPISLAWCPDSRCVLASDSVGPDQADAVYLVSLETGEKRQLTKPQGLVGDSDPAMSPDGRSLIFRRDATPFSGQFYRLPLKDHGVVDGEPVRLTSTLTAGKPVWLPGSREVLFSSRGALWRLDAFAGAAPTRLPFVGQDGHSPVVSRTSDGRQRLLYVRSFADTNVWRIDTPAPGATALSPPAPAIASTRADLVPNVSPDGQRVVFLSDRSGDTEFWLADPDGSNAFQLTSMGILPGYPRWSPDGMLIAFHGDPEGRPDVLVVPATGGQPRILTKGGAAGAYPTFSRDGRWIYFCSGLVKGGSRIWKMPVSGGAAVQVTDNLGSLAIESSDGDLYYVDAMDRPGSVWRLAHSGGAPVKLIDGVALGNFDVLPHGIYYIDRPTGDAGVFLADGPGGDTRLQYFDFATARSITIAHGLGTVGLGLTAAPDGRAIFYTRIDSSVDELMIVDGFR